MKQFVSCQKVGEGGGEAILLAVDDVKIIYRHFREDRGDIIEDYQGNKYACYLPEFEGGEPVGWVEDFDHCILTFGMRVREIRGR